MGEKFTQFYNSFGFITSFMVLTLVISMTFGGEITEKFLLLILLSMVLFNNDVFEAIAKNLGG